MPRGAEVPYEVTESGSLAVESAQAAGRTPFVVDTIRLSGRFELHTELLRLTLTLGIWGCVKLG